jgi:hypothetical protein
MRNDTQQDAIQRLIELNQADHNSAIHESFFPPNLDPSKQLERYSDTYHALDSSNFDPHGICSVCSLVIPCVTWPHITLLDPIASNCDSIRPHLIKLKNQSAPIKPLASYTTDTILADLLLDENGITNQNGSSHLALRICSRCYNQLRDPTYLIPKFALANNLFSLSFVVNSLPELNFTEEKVICRLRLNCYVVKLTVKSRHSQLGFKGHVIAFKQQPDTLLCHPILPYPANQLGNMIHILFVTSKKLDETTRSLIPFKDIFKVDRQKITLWLQFLKK